jgi:hypothetical protein
MFAFASWDNMRRARLFMARDSVLERPGLEARACECYQEVKTEFDRLLPYAVCVGLQTISRWRAELSLWVPLCATAPTMQQRRRTLKSTK